MYGLISKLTATPGNADRLAAVLASVGPMPGCFSYVVARDLSDADGVWVTELWESAEAHRRSLDLPEVQAAIAAGRPMIDGFEHRFETEPISGTSP